MNGSVFTETLRQNWRQMLYWGIGFGLTALLIVVIIPGADAMQPLIELMESMPPAFTALIGVDADNIEWIASPEGFIAIGFFGKMLLLMAAYPAIMGIRVTANEEDEGVMDMLLSLPVARWRVVLEKFLAFAVTLIVVCALVFVGLWVGEQIMQLGLDMGRMGESVFNMLPAMLLILAFTTLIGTMISRKRIIIGIVAGFVLVSYMLLTVGQMAEGSIAENIQLISFFTYNDAPGVVQSGLVWINMIGLTIVAVIMVAASLWFFERRDVGT